VGILRTSRRESTAVNTQDSKTPGAGNRLRTG
jgi:hypothetical protein